MEADRAIGAGYNFPAMIRWLPAKNNSNSTYIPANGLVRIVSVDCDGKSTAG
jgi:hypothetical protein